MNFCDIPAEAFPKGAQFYHNVTVIVFSVAEYGTKILTLFGILTS